MKAFGKLSFIYLCIYFVQVYKQIFKQLSLYLLFHFLTQGILSQCLKFEGCFNGVFSWLKTKCHFWCCYKSEICKLGRVFVLLLRKNSSVFKGIFIFNDSWGLHCQIWNLTQNLANQFWFQNNIYIFHTFISIFFSILITHYCCSGIFQC